MIVVVEGPDNAGKSTLAIELAKLMKAIYMKNEQRPRKASDLNEYHFVLLAANRVNKWVIADRHMAISEPIYGPICRGMHVMQKNEVDACIRSLSVIIYCRPSSKVIMDTLGDRPQMEGVLEHTPEIITAYDEFFGQHSLGPKVIRYNYLKQTAAEIHADLEDFRRATSGEAA